MLGRRLKQFRCFGLKERMRSDWIIFFEMVLFKEWWVTGSSCSE